MEKSNWFLDHIGSLSLLLLALLVGLGAWKALQRYRAGEQRAAKGWLLALLGLGGPWVAALAFAANFGYMQKPQFCFSCHIMKPFYQDLNDPKSDGLAAKHHQNNWLGDNSCYKCHTDYGAFGGVKAKLNGLKHAYVHYLTNKQDRPKLYKPYQSANCLQCHGGSNRRYTAVVEHQDAAEDLASGEASCLDCHDVIHNVDGAWPQAVAEKQPVEAMVKPVKKEGKP